jgi:hypothetical protein
VAELGVPVGVGRAFARLAVGLQAVPGGAQEFPHQLMADAVAHALERSGQGSHAFRGPAQRSVRGPRGSRLDQPLQIAPQRGVLVDLGGEGLACRGTGPTDRAAAWGPCRWSVCGPHPVATRVPAAPARATAVRSAREQSRGGRNAGGPHHQRQATPTEGARLGRRPHAARSLGQRRRQRAIFRSTTPKVHSLDSILRSLGFHHSLSYEP